MSSRITREIIEIAAAMQVKALAFDREHPNNSLGTRSAATYAAAIRALVPEQEGLEISVLMAEAGERAMRRLLLARPNDRILM
jgi:precorrin-6x reductase